MLCVFSLSHIAYYRRSDLQSPFFRTLLFYPFFDIGLFGLLSFYPPAPVVLLLAHWDPRTRLGVYLLFSSSTHSFSFCLLLRYTERVGRLLQAWARPTKEQRV